MPENFLDELIDEFRFNRSVHSFQLIVGVMNEQTEHSNQREGSETWSTTWRVDKLHSRVKQLLQISLNIQSAFIECY